MSFGLWSEFADDDTVRGALPELGRLGLRLHLALPAARLGDAGLAALTREAADHGVDVFAWLLLDRAHGYWVGETNAEQVREAVLDLLRWRSARDGVALRGVSFDLEPDFEYAETLRHSPVFRWLPLMKQHLHADKFTRAQQVLSDTVDRLHQADVFAHAVTLPLVLDQPEGSTLLEDALDIPVSGIPWDEVSFMVYQTAFAQLVGEWLGPALVQSYAEDAIARFGERAGLDLGVVGSAGIGIDPGRRYPDPETLRQDAAAARAAGIKSLRVYSLDGVLEQGGPERWLPPREIARPGGTRREVLGLRNAVATLVRALGI
ncbi:MAG: hypothetical protein KC776_06425 [Myxococcales bacterium]|nr:hypothetical protein [Myxococcales bacterium]MCB9583669.1 hypothetical protein [Polyangiaceae bacterium]